MKLILVSLGALCLSASRLSVEEVGRSKACFLRCFASCVEKEAAVFDQKLRECEHTCREYEKDSLCKVDDTDCWSICRDLKPIGNSLETQPPRNLTGEFRNEKWKIEWDEVPGASAYYVEFKSLEAENATFKEAAITAESSLNLPKNPFDQFCEAFAVRVKAVWPDAISDFSSEALVDSPMPNVSFNLQIKSMRYLDKKYVSDFYEANGSIVVTFEFDERNWPLGASDIEVEPMFHQVHCVEEDLAVVSPLPEFHRTSNPREIKTVVGADAMYRSCRYAYYANEAESLECNTKQTVSTPPPLQIVDISCNTVEDSPCRTDKKIPGPICGQTEELHYELLNKTINPDDKVANLTVNVSFTPFIRNLESPTLFYIALVGNAIPYNTTDEAFFYGVNQTNVISNATTCEVFDKATGTCIKDTNTSLLISGLHIDQVYGITICAVKDVRNQTLVPIEEISQRSNKPHASKIHIQSEYYRISRAPLLVGVIIGVLSFFIITGCGLFCVYQRRHIRERSKLHMKLTELKKDKQLRPYVDLPRKVDIWEVDRRNVDVHTTKLLGKGAFGDVYQGKLIGKSLGNRNANSTLGINLMRVENCIVAVKRLPDNAEPSAKEEFLREITLMKAIGFHERLVNMLACVTHSEPYLLVVEFCSDGDLLQFLKERGKYMIKLGESGVHFTGGPPEENFDDDMIVSMKQLLMYAVQISYGLEYLSQKGFVHRDVAARNVLVHEKKECKIGDFGLCRKMNEDSNYKSRGGRLPLRWMSPEAIRNYDFSTKSDVWSFGVLLFELITLGGTPYPTWHLSEVVEKLEKGERLEQPDNCPDTIYELMLECFSNDPSDRPDFSQLRFKLGNLLEEVTDEYSYLKLDAQQNYYNVADDRINGKVSFEELPLQLPRAVVTRST